MGIKSVFSRHKALIMVVSSVIILCVGIYIYLLVPVIAKQNTYNPVASSCIIILGHSLDNDNNPSEWLVERLETGYGYYKLGYAEHIIVTGGSVGSKPTVASVMTQWLLEKGVPAEIILTEERSKNTAENFSYSKELAENHGIKSVLVITNDFHMPRSMMIAEDFFEDPSGAAANCSLSIRKILAYMKEPLSILKYTALKPTYTTAG